MRLLGPHERRNRGARLDAGRPGVDGDGASGGEGQRASRPLRIPITTASS
jgi:hypothetical protein